MYIIVVYDVSVSRVNKVKKVTLAEYERIKKGIKELINENEDSVIIYKLRSRPKRKNLGIEKNPVEDII
ncbi:CRISPR-associated protein Cas2 [Thermococcus sp. EP1]|uniref:CRISPR-associated endonuclease Cas2 n=1 Tax=Thermococcus sp. EP1 TaxID=1591054 RepID=UPI0006DA33A4|nr:CRISPR-associated protein Cas2 [Thermococcus sp. EP1]KPU62405.1 CRISPR-associated protein Cas2 [Thermococcus sp. EP1]